MTTQPSSSSSSSHGLPTIPTFRSPNLTKSTSNSTHHHHQDHNQGQDNKMIMPMNMSNKINGPRPLPSSQPSTSNSPTVPSPPVTASRPRVDSFFGATTDQDDLQTSNRSDQPDDHISSTGANQMESIQSPQITCEPATPLPTVNLHNQHQHDRVPYRQPNQFDENNLDDQIEDDTYLPSPNAINPMDRPSSFYGLERHMRHSTQPGPSASTRMSPSNSNQYPNQESEALQVDSMRRASYMPNSRNSRTMTWSGSQMGSNRMSVYNRNSMMAGQSDGFPPPMPAGPLLDHSHLKPGAKAKLLNHAKTLELYRANAKKTNDVEVTYEFACFLMDLVKEMHEEDDERRSINSQNTTSSPTTSKSSSLGRSPEREKEKASLTQEAIGLLQKLANRGHVESQFLLADSYTKGIGTGGGGQLVPSGLIVPSTGPVGKSSRQDYDRAFPLFVLAAKHGHVEAMFRAGQCLEHGWGTRKERDKALQFYRKAAIAQHPLAMYRLGLADLNGDLGSPRRPKDGVKWLKRAAETADVSNPKPLHELALLHERGIEHVVFVDFDYAVELLARAAELGYAPSAYKLGECYEYGRMGCPQDSALSIHYYNIAAQQNHKEACFALTAWYLVGSSGVLPQSDTEAYLWAKKAAEAGLAKAEYAIGYFTEVGIGTKRNERDAIDWFRKAAEHGDKRAMERLKNGSGRISGGAGASGGTGKGDLGGKSSGKKGKEGKEGKEDCLVM